MNIFKPIFLGGILPSLFLGGCAMDLHSMYEDLTISRRVQVNIDTTEKQLLVDMNATLLRIEKLLGGQSSQDQTQDQAPITQNERPTLVNNSPSPMVPNSALYTDVENSHLEPENPAFPRPQEGTTITPDQAPTPGAEEIVPDNTPSQADPNAATPTEEAPPAEQAAQTENQTATEIPLSPVAPEAVSPAETTPQNENNPGPDQGSTEEQPKTNEEQANPQVEEPTNPPSEEQTNPSAVEVNAPAETTTEEQANTTEKPAEEQVNTDTSKSSSLEGDVLTEFAEELTPKKPHRSKKNK